MSYVVDEPTAITVDTFMTEYVFISKRLFFCISTTMVGVIAVERFLVIFFPFSTSTMLSPRKMKLAAAGTYLINALFIIQAFPAVSLEWEFNETYNQTGAVIRLSYFYDTNYDTINFENLIIYNVGVLGTSMVLTMICTPRNGKS